MEEEQDPGKNLFNSINHFFKELFEIRRDSHEENTVKTISENISMKGANAWILIFSILIASIGLNANSTAVVIGAMLISPLMGPILGLGLSVGINDLDMLRRSLINLGVMVGLSLLTSFLYFSIPLFQEGTPEILARIRPDVRDVLIALSGGLALIIAISRPRPQTNTVAGVAIGTALMPPLCVAGFGLATGRIDYFLGAMFLFTINGIFIAIATLGIVRYLHFSMVKYLDQTKRRRISRAASAIAVLIVAGSLWTFYNLFKEKQYTNNALSFVHQLKDEGVSILGDEKEIIDYPSKTITLQLLGRVPGETVESWQTQMEELGLKADLIVRQSSDSDIAKKIENLESLYNQNQKIISTRDQSILSKDQRIRQLEDQLENYVQNQIDFKVISDEAKINYPDLNQLRFSQREIATNFETLDTIAVVEIQWDEEVKTVDKISQQPKLVKWLEKRMELDTLLVR